DSTLVGWREVGQELGFRSLVSLPLQTSRAVLGAVTFYFASRGEVSDDNRQHFAHAGGTRRSHHRRAAAHPSAGQGFERAVAWADRRSARAHGTEARR